LWFQGKAGPHGGNETTVVVSLYIPMAHLEFVTVPTGYTQAKIVQGHGTPYGSSSILGQKSRRRNTQARVTSVAAALKVVQPRMS